MNESNSFLSISLAARDDRIRRQIYQDVQSRTAIYQIFPYKVVASIPERVSRPHGLASALTSPMTWAQDMPTDRHETGSEQPTHHTCSDRIQPPPKDTDAGPSKHTNSMCSDYNFGVGLLGGITHNECTSTNGTTQELTVRRV